MRLLLLLPLFLLLLFLFYFFLFCSRENDGHVAAQHAVTASLLIAPKLISVGKFMALMGLEKKYFLCSSLAFHHAYTESI